MDHQWLSMRASYMDFNVSIPYSQFVVIGEDIGSTKFNQGYVSSVESKCTVDINQFYIITC
jgi:hypothetical protein